ncbi:hypothetical protein FQR65_LT05776 [Abscondita terminalis]|nr:hypothetical protein FQR65_LT05776 [Abscondita terminalis]
MSSLIVECDLPPKDEGRPQELKRKHMKKKEAIVKPPTTLERVFGRPNKPRDHYFTAGVSINESNQRNIHAEALPFSYPTDLEEFSYRLMAKAWRDSRIQKDNKKKVQDRQSQRTRQKLDLLNRLYVKDAETKSLKTILDVDPNFFSLIEGRPIPQKFNRWDYIGDVRDVLRTKIVTGYREDEIMLLDENFSEEMKAIEEIKSEFQKYVNTFEEFLFNDHTSAMTVLQQSETEAHYAHQKSEELRTLSEDYGSLRSTVYNLEEKWRNCKMYQKFLYIVSPMEWRRKYDFYFMTEDTSTSQIARMREESSIFARFRLSPFEVQSLDSLIDQFLEDVKIQEEPELYFTDPNQLMKVFSFIELQNLNTLLHSEELAAPLQHVLEVIDATQIAFDAEVTRLQEMIDSLEGGIIWEEERAKHLEELALELIYGDFREIVSNKEVLDLHVFVEDVYENRIGVNDSNLTMKDMMRIIEVTYRDYLLQLDRLPDDLVYKAEMTCYREEEKSMQLAMEAAKKVIQVERLMKHLTRLLDPPISRTHRALVWRSPPVDKRKRVVKKHKNLTAEELEYLDFFEDVCYQTNEPPSVISTKSNKASK